MESTSCFLFNMGIFTDCVLSQEAAQYLPVRRWKRRPSRAVARLAYALYLLFWAPSSSPVHNSVNTTTARLSDIAAQVFFPG